MDATSSAIHGSLVNKYHDAKTYQTVSHKQQTQPHASFSLDFSSSSSHSLAHQSKKIA